MSGIMVRVDHRAVVAFCALFVLLGATNADAEVPRPKWEDDLKTCREYLWAWGERPSDELVWRVADRAKAAPDDLDALYWAGQFRVDGRLDGEEYYEGLKRAADRGHPPGMALHGVVLLGGGGKPRSDVEGGIKLIQQALDRGEPMAFYRMAMVSVAADGPRPRDVEKAEVLAKEAMRRGVLRGLTVLAHVAKDRGDTRQVMEYRTRAAEAGDPEAMNDFFEVYAFGSKPDPEKAAHWARRGALLGHPLFMRQYAVMLELELIGLKRDQVLSRRLLTRAAAQGDEVARAELASGQVTGAYGVPLDREAGLLTLRSQVADNVPYAMTCLGALLVSGEHVPPDKTAGIALLKRAAEKGELLAKRVLETVGQ